MQSFSAFRIYLLIFVLGIILFIPFLGDVHLFDWDEINFAEAAREMIVSGNYTQVQINYEPFWEKPPLFIWLEVLSMKLFGVNEFAARLPNAICGIATLLLLFNIGKKLYDNEFGIWWVLCYAGSLLPHFYFKSGIIDPVFNLFIFLGIYYFYCYYSFKEFNKIILSAIFIGLATLTKGPVAFLIFILCLMSFWLIHKFKKIISLKDFFIFCLVVCSISFAWFGMEIVKNGFWFVKEFISYQFRLLSSEDAGHGGPFYYHFVVLLMGCFPASLFFIQILFKKNKEDIFLLLMKILFWVVLILFSIVRTKIIHYSSLAYFPITFLAAHYLQQLNNGKIHWGKWLRISILITGGIIGIALTLLPFLSKNKELIVPYIQDDFAIACLDAKVQWNGLEMGIGILFLALLFISPFLISNKKIKEGILLLFFSVVITLQLSMFFIVPKIERYSQGTAIDFYKSLGNTDCYLHALGFKSYAPLFYGKIKPENKIPGKDILLKGKIDKPAYFVCKNTSAKDYENEPNLKKLKEENGFVFFVREKN